MTNTEPNPFTRCSNPQSAREHQANANYATYERMRADAELREYDRLGIKAPPEVIADAHTCRWVEKEMIRLARKARTVQRAAA